MFIEDSVRSGRFASRDDVVQQAIELLEQREQALEQLRTSTDEADEDIRRGRYTEYSDDSLPQLGDELKREGRMLRNRKPA